MVFTADLHYFGCSRRPVDEDRCAGVSMNACASLNSNFSIELRLYVGHLGGIDDSSQVKTVSDPH